MHHSTLAALPSSRHRRTLLPLAFIATSGCISCFGPTEPAQHSTGRYMALLIRGTDTLRIDDTLATSHQPVGLGYTIRFVLPPAADRMLEPSLREGPHELVAYKTYVIERKPYAAVDAALPDANRMGLPTWIPTAPDWSVVGGHYAIDAVGRPRTAIRLRFVVLLRHGGTGQISEMRGEGSTLP